MAREAAVLIALGTLTVVSYWSQWSRTRPVVEAPSVVAVTPEAKSGAIAAAATAAPVANGPAPKADRSRQLELPDGTFVAALNGARDPAPLHEFWGSQIPWSPIVGVEQNEHGVDWYRHENGSYSTTQMVWRSDLKRHAAMTRVGHPGPAVTPAVGR